MSSCHLCFCLRRCAHCLHSHLIFYCYGIHCTYHPPSIPSSPYSSAASPSIPTTSIFLSDYSTSTLSFLFSSISRLPTDRNLASSVWGRNSREPSSTLFLFPLTPLPPGEEIESSGGWGQGGSPRSLPMTSHLSPAQSSPPWPRVSHALPRSSAPQL